MSPLLLEQLTSIAHQLWCARMEEYGWKPGPVYDAAARTHDALGPFEELSPSDQRHARDATRASGAIEILSRCIEYPRGLDLPTPFDQIVIGRRVRLVQTDRIEEIQVEPDDVGVVEEIERAGDRIVRVVVRWPSGDRTAHAEGDDDLALAANS